MSARGFGVDICGSFVVILAVWVPSTRGLWQQCELLGPCLGEEPIQRCAELMAVLGAQGRLVKKLLEHPKVPRYDAFRITGRDAGSGSLVGLTQWQRSAETHLFISTTGPWTECEWKHGKAVGLAA